METSYNLVLRDLLFALALTCLLLAGCESEKEKMERKIKAQILGEWEVYHWISPEYWNSGKYSPDDMRVWPFAGDNEGFRLSNDQLDYYEGFIRETIIDGASIYENIGTVTEYDLRHDSIFVLNPVTQEWEFWWKFIRCRNDTLTLWSRENKFAHCTAINTDPGDAPEFDVIYLSTVFSHSNWLSQDICLDANGNVKYRGWEDVNPIGVFSGKIDAARARYIIDKFRSAFVTNLSNIYLPSDLYQDAASVTMVKEGKIIKTVFDGGKTGSKELSWAYAALEGLYTQITLTPIPEAERLFWYQPRQIRFIRDTVVFDLKQSESFFLWHELSDAPAVSCEPVEVYHFEIFDDWLEYQPETLRENVLPYLLTSVISDGQVFSLRYKNGEVKNLDIGYDFFKRHFPKRTFKKPFTPRYH